MANRQSGVAGFNPIPSGKMYGTGQFNLVNGAATLLELNTICTGFIDAIEDIVNHKMVTGVLGYYGISGLVGFTNVVVNKHYGAYIYINGAVKARAELSAAAVGQIYVPIPYTLFKLVGTENIELKAVSYSGDDTVDIIGGESATYLCVQRVR